MDELGEFTTTVEHFNNSNATENVLEEDDEALLLYRLKQTTDVLSILTVVIATFGMGCTMTLVEVWKHVKPPTGVIIGMVSQFVLLPAGAFGVAHLLHIESTYALGVLLLATCPGGAISNIFTYWTNGDVTLSIVMTIVSTVAALGMMPLNLYIYSRSWTTLTIAVPYIQIIIGLAMTLVPLGLGMIVRWKRPQNAKMITNISSVLSILIIYCLVGMRWRMRPSWIWESPVGLYIAAALQNPVGWVLGYVFAMILRQTHKTCRTIAIETGTQHVGLCLTLIIQTFPLDTQWTIIAYPLTAGILQIVQLTALTGIWHIYWFVMHKFFGKKYIVEEPLELEDKKVENVQTPVKQDDKKQSNVNAAFDSQEIIRK